MLCYDLAKIMNILIKNPFARSETKVALVSFVPMTKNDPTAILVSILFP